MKILIIIISTIFSTTMFAQVGIGTTTPAATSLLDVTSTSKGFLVPRMTSTQKSAISSPATGLLVYQTDGTAGFYYYTGSAWVILSKELLSKTEGTNFTGSLLIGHNTTGTLLLANGNTGVGLTTLKSITSGNFNTATGYNALFSHTNGFYNTAFGAFALNYNTEGWSNTAIGYYSLINNTGSQNTAVGYNAGSNVTTGSNLTLLGYNAQPSSATATNQITLGNSVISSLRCQVTSITSLSDKRDKQNITKITEGIDFVKKLNPVTFEWNTRDKAKVGIKAAGFIAQELLELQNNSAIGKNLDLVSTENPDKLEARYGNLLPVLVKAIQEQQEQMQKQQELISDLKKEVNKLKSKSEKDYSSKE